MDGRISLVVPLFNGRQHIRATLDSLLAQEGVTTEIIVVDDGSSDDGADLVRSHYSKIRLISSENGGVATARNRGLAEAGHEWVAFVDQDDLWHPERGRTLLDLARQTGHRMVATTETPFARTEDRASLFEVADGREHWPKLWVDGEGELATLLASSDLARLEDEFTVETIDHSRFLAAPVSLTTAFLFDRKLAIAAGGCATFVRALDDHVLNINCSRIAGGAARIDIPMLYYRVHPASATVTSPLVAPYLFMLLAMRWGRVYDPERLESDYIAHLLRQLPSSPLSRHEQLALLSLTAAPGQRLNQFGGWMKRSLKKAARSAQA